MSSQTICLLEKLLGKQDLQISLESFHLSPYQHIQPNLAAGLEGVKEVTLIRQMDKNSTLILTQSNSRKVFLKMIITIVSQNANGLILTFQNPIIDQVNFRDVNNEMKEEILVNFTKLQVEYVAPKATDGNSTINRIKSSDKQFKKTMDFVRG